MSAAPPQGRRRAALWALLLGLFVFGLRAPLMDLPLERDEGGYAYIAWRLAEGETPYLDWFDQKPPGIFVAYALALGSGADPRLAIRVVAALCCAVSAVALFAVMRLLLGEAAGRVAGLLLAALSADPALQGPIANTELFMTPWILLAAWGTLRISTSRPPPWAGLAIGLLLGVASAFKQVAFVNVPFLLAVFWLRTSGPRRGRALARFAVAMGAGGALVWGAIAAWLLARGGFAAALDAILLHNLSYSAQLTLSQRLALLSYHVTPMLPSQGVAWLLAGAGLVWLGWRRQRFPALFLAGFAALNALGVSASGLYFPHYFQQLLPAVAGLASAGVLAVADAVRPPLRRATLALVAAVALAPPGFGVVELARLDPAQATQRLYPGSVFEAMPAIAEEIAAQTRPDDRVFIFGAEPEILFQAGRISASRYIYLFPLYGAFPGVEERQRGVIAELEAARPAAIVWIPNQMFFAPGSPQRLTEWVARYVDASYRLHAYVAAEGESRGVLRRLEPGEDARARQSSARPWATIFLRVRDAAAAPASP